MTSMGPDPRKFRVLPAGGFLGLLLADVLGRVERLMQTKTRHDWRSTVSFNTIGLKVCCGEDAPDGIKWEDGEFLSINSCNKIGQHTDFQFLVKGKEVAQVSSDSADGRHPIATVATDTVRDLILSRQERRGGCKKLATKIATFELGQNSLLILLPWKDEVPMKRGRTMRRKVCEATSRGEGVSIAMVF